MHIDMEVSVDRDMRAALVALSAVKQNDSGRQTRDSRNRGMTLSPIQQEIAV